MKTVKKTVLLLVAAAVLFGCIFAAGCVEETEKTPVLSISIEKEGALFYNIGDTFTVTLPSNPSTGYSWYATEAANLKCVESSAAAESGLVGAPGSQTFVFSAEKEGTYLIELTYKRAGEDAGIYVYQDVLFVKKGDQHAAGKFVFAGDYLPNAGDLVEITVSGNPASTGYQWFASADEGLTIVDETFIPANTDLVGAPGMYVWHVTADTPGAYIFYGTLARSADETDPAGFFFVPVSFGLPVQE
ncbi:MAG TPA: protease inhibitor I42 family protein [Methanocorpusculum sp.]|nr:protease inhibitor I42 family protein [Methanocorpusculum sp.]